MKREFMDINKFMNLLVYAINESNLPFVYIDTNDTSATLKITTTDKSEFLLTVHKLDNVVN